MKYYFFGTQRIALQEVLADGTSTLAYLVGDHLGSTTVVLDAAGAVLGEARYTPYGHLRYTRGTLPTDRRFTDQRWEGDALAGLYDYKARFYDPGLGLFLQADTIVPEPGRPIALNRYAYAYNNPINFVDPTGHDGCAASDRACWEREWYAKDRWYRAHGYFFDSATGHWRTFADRFADVDDVGIATEVLGEFGVVLNGAWSNAEIIAIASGVADLGRTVGGPLQFSHLMGGTVTIRDRSQRPLHGCLWGAGCTPPPPLADGRTIYAYGTTAVDRYWVVHELAHIIDWASRIEVQNLAVDLRGRRSSYTGQFSDAWAAATTTDYGTCWRCIQRWERWAEAVTSYVYDRNYRQTRRSLSGPEQEIMKRLLTSSGW